MGPSSINGYGKIHHLVSQQQISNFAFYFNRDKEFELFSVFFPFRVKQGLWFQKVMMFLLFLLYMWEFSCLKSFLSRAAEFLLHIVKKTK